MRLEIFFSLRILLLAALMLTGPAMADDPLPSWNDGPTKTAIINFVARVTSEHGSDFVPAEQRIATFDNDGTLWVEYPMYTQVLFSFERVKELAKNNPDWESTMPFSALLEDDFEAFASFGVEGLLEVVLATHSGMTEQDFAQEVSTWLANTQQSKFKRPFTELVYQPQIELLQYLRNNGFKTYIVSGGGVSFMRPFTLDAYGIPPQQVIGSRVKSEYKTINGEPQIVRLPEVDFINDKAGKPVGINQHIGQRPIFAFGNSDSDMQMIEYTMAGEGLRMGLFVHHTDDVREYKYDRDSHVGTLDKAMDKATDMGWHIVDMRRDWKLIFAFENTQ